MKYAVWYYTMTRRFWEWLWGDTAASAAALEKWLIEIGEYPDKYKPKK